MKPTRLESQDRFTACRALHRAGISFVIWADDAGNHFRDPIRYDRGFRDLFLLVENPQQAAASLKTAGFFSIPSNPTFEDIPRLSTEAPRLVYPGREAFLSIRNREVEEWDLNSTSTVLLPAADWSYTLPTSQNCLEDMYPTLHGFIDALAATLFDLRAEDSKLRDHIGRSIVWLYNNLETLTYDFADKLRPEHRQLHFDLAAPYELDQPLINTPPNWARHRAIRDAIRSGTHVPTSVPKVAAL